MTGASHDVFVDRRTEPEINAGLATHILFWYDTDKKGRQRTNGVAMTTEGHLVVARSTCSKKDQFVKSHGRMIVSRRIFGCDLAISRRGQTPRHSAKLHVFGVTVSPGAVSDEQIPDYAARAYEDMFSDEMGRKRAYNVGKIFVRYRDAIKLRADALLDDFNQ